MTKTLKSDVKLFRRGGQTHIRFLNSTRSDLVCSEPMEIVIALQDLRKEGLHIPQAMIDRRLKKHSDIMETLGAKP